MKICWKKCLGQSLLFASSVLAISCGGSSGGGGPGGASVGEIELAFQQASSKYEIPVSIMKAVAFSETGMEASPSSAWYAGVDIPLGVSAAQTAFGVPYVDLELDPAADQSKELIVQIDAYAKWVRVSLDKQSLKLSPSIGTPIDLYDWAWQIALLQRDGINTRRNVQIIFARELINKINKGDLWQNPKTGEIVALNPPAQQINITELPPQVQSNLKLFMDEASIPSALFFELTYQEPSDKRNVPKGVIVTHCPFSLSACLEIQHSTRDEDQIRVGAHYIVPPDTSLVAKPLQIAQHGSTVELTGKDGTAQKVDDSIVVMLVGDSGHYVEGKRVTANPMWLTKLQMRKLGTVIKMVCLRLGDVNPDIDVDYCMKPGVDGGVQFVSQGNSEEYQWGDIADFDESIFYAYVKNPDALRGRAEFNFHAPKNTYQAGQDITFDLNFIKGVTRIVVEKAERCVSDKLIWTVQQNHEVRNVNQKAFNMSLYTQGPNRDSEHFFRALVYDITGRLTGWAVDHIYLNAYEKDQEIARAGVKACTRNGS